MDSEQMIEQQMLAEMQAQEQAAAKEKDMKIDLLFDLSLQVSIELGRTKMLIKDILELQRGSVIELEKLASEPVDILVNGKKVAEGEVVVIEKHFGIRITSLIESAERLKNLGA
ncbi:MAG: flagellar motor switch protein FliN [Bacteroidetes bacterium]|nr:flagellar motor switch protein FliN [Bacteroidota bacterium]